MPGDCRLRAVSVTRIAYTASGWGEGELWFEGRALAWRELARAAGSPNAQRAAGTFCAQNRFPLLVPCHRVVGADGIGSYGSLGVAYKRRLLELEGVTL